MIESFLSKRFSGILINVLDNFTQQLIPQCTFSCGLLYSPRDKLVGGPLGPVLGVNHEEHVGETSAEIRSICVVVPGGLWCVDVHAFRTVQLHHGLSWDI